MIHAGSTGDTFDGQASVLVGGDLGVIGRATGAEGVVVVRGTVAVARDQPGPYRVGVTDTGSQVTPHPGSDVLVVGGDLAAAPDNPLEVAPGLDGDVAVGGSVVEGTVVSQGGGRLDQGVGRVLAAYDDLLGALTAKSLAYAALPATGTVEVTDTAIVLTGDGTSALQVLTAEAGLLERADGGPGRELLVAGVPAGAAVVVNLGGPEVDLAVDAVRGPDRQVVDAGADPYFADLATHLLWNVPEAQAVRVTGAAQLPGSLLVGSEASTTVVEAAGTNGRLLVAGDLVHAGAGELHSYPFPADPDLACGPDLPHRGTVTLDVVLDDPAGLVDPDRFVHGTYACRLGDQDVTPGDGTWRLRARATDRVVADDVPVGAVCSVEQQLEVPSGPGWDWVEPDVAPRSVTVAKREPRGFTLSNGVRPVEPPPDDPEPQTDTPDPPTTPLIPDPVEPPVTVPEPPPVDQSVADLPDVELVRPSDTVGDPEPPPEPPVEPEADASADVAAAPAPEAPGPLTTTAPYSLRGTFVWAPLLLLSVLALRLRFPWRYKRRKRLY